MSCFNLPTDTKGRKLLNISVKKKIIELAESGVKQKDIAVMFGLGRSTVTKILLNKDNVLKAAYENINDPRYRIRKDEFYALELKIFKWSIEPNTLTYELEENDPDLIPKHASTTNKFKDGITREDVFKKATEIASQLDFKNFIPTDKWFNKFKRKFNIRFRRCIKDKNYNKTNSDNQIDGMINVDKSKLDSPESSNFNSEHNYIVKSNVSEDYYPFNSCPSRRTSPYLINGNNNAMLFENANFGFDHTQFNHQNFISLNQSNTGLLYENLSLNNNYHPVFDYANPLYVSPIQNTFFHDGFGNYTFQL